VGSRRGIIAHGTGTGLYSSKPTEGGVELFAFTREYVERLREGDPSTEQHFVSYFDQLLRIKLRAKRLASETVEDLRQETYIRVFNKVRAGEIREPDRFGAFVNSICNNVLQEFYRLNARTTGLDPSHEEKPDDTIDIEGQLVTKQMKERVREVLRDMPKKDRELLQAFFLDEKEKDEVCAQFDVDRDYLRVLLHRAKDKFRVLYEKDRVALSGKLPPKVRRGAP
jgi:RNA polymerase sigma-70 factor, ECF subfamily